MSDFMKIRPAGIKLLHTDGWTDEQTGITEVIVALRSFANALKIVLATVLLQSSNM